MIFQNSRRGCCVGVLGWGRSTHPADIFLIFFPLIRDFFYLEVIFNDNDSSKNNAKMPKVGHASFNDMGAVNPPIDFTFFPPLAELFSHPMELKAFFPTPWSFFRPLGALFLPLGAFCDMLVLGANPPDQIDSWCWGPIPQGGRAIPRIGLAAGARG